MQNEHEKYQLSENCKDLFFAIQEKFPDYVSKSYWGVGDVSQPKKTIYFYGVDYRDLQVNLMVKDGILNIYAFKYDNGHRLLNENIYMDKIEFSSIEGFLENICAEVVRVVESKL